MELFKRMLVVAFSSAIAMTVVSDVSAMELNVAAVNVTKNAAVNVTKKVAKELVAAGVIGIGGLMTFVSIGDLINICSGSLSYSALSYTLPFGATGIAIGAGVYAHSDFRQAREIVRRIKTTTVVNAAHDLFTEEGSSSLSESESEDE